ncbi:hypothetical protein CALCODRAFT_509769 [Calocera cornea HHB12733]|uniref:Uncharacterized protein n=1 Tax=Calocera cornea HHB12733 TaxID=1353952 RepID=A0A165F258_9BASI|nr:hypothetical protein CALCODRAFT_509769 [Calocera cornea HHB12733]
MTSDNWTIPILDKDLIQWVRLGPGQQLRVKKDERIVIKTSDVNKNSPQIEEELQHYRKLTGQQAFQRKRTSPASSLTRDTILPLPKTPKRSHHAIDPAASPDIVVISPLEFKTTKQDNWASAQQFGVMSARLDLYLSELQKHPKKQRMAFQAAFPADLE